MDEVLLTEAFVVGDELFCAFVLGPLQRGFDVCAARDCLDGAAYVGSCLTECAIVAASSNCRLRSVGKLLE